MDEYEKLEEDLKKVYEVSVALTWKGVCLILPVLTDTVVLLHDSRIYCT